MDRIPFFKIKCNLCYLWEIQKFRLFRLRSKNTDNRSFDQKVQKIIYFHEKNFPI